MKNVGKATLYLDRDLHRALKFKATEVEKSVSELVNEAVRRSLMEDSEDLEAFEERKGEKSFAFELALKKLKQSGKL